MSIVNQSKNVSDENIIDKKELEKLEKTKYEELFYETMGQFPLFRTWYWKTDFADTVNIGHSKDIDAMKFYEVFNEKMGYPNIKKNLVLNDELKVFIDKYLRETHLVPGDLYLMIGGIAKDPNGSSFDISFGAVILLDKAKPIRYKYIAGFETDNIYGCKGIVESRRLMREENEIRKNTGPKGLKSDRKRVILFFVGCLLLVIFLISL